MSDASPEVHKHTLQTLRSLEPGFLPLPYFLEFSRLSVSSVVEMVPLRMSAESGLEVLLFQRPDDDPVWPKMWGNPGTVLRPSDKPGSLDDAFERIFTDDMAGIEISDTPVFAGNAFFASERGLHFAAVHWIEVDQPGLGRFYPVNDLPPDFVKCQAGVLGMATEDYRLACADEADLSVHDLGKIMTGVNETICYQLSRLASTLERAVTDVPSYSLLDICRLAADLQKLRSALDLNTQATALLQD